MSSKYVIDTVWDYLTANWTATRLIDPENTFDDVQVSGDPLTEWATAMPEGAVETQVSIGFPDNNRWREDGSIALIAFVPSGTGTARALELAEALRDLFRGKQIDDGAGGSTITFRDVQPPDTALPSVVDASSGNWFGYSVSATYYCDTCRDTS